MAITRKTVVDQIEITRTGHIQFRLGKLLVEDGKELSSQWHRSVVEPGGDVEAQMAVVNAHLVQMGEAEVDAAGIAKIKAQAQAAWTPEVLGASSAEVLAAIATVQVQRLALAGAREQVKTAIEKLQVERGQLERTLAQG